MRSASAIAVQVLLLAALVPVTCLAQDSTRTKVKAAFRPLFQFDSRYTFINGRSVQFFGMRLGAQKGNDILAIGFYGIGDHCGAIVCGSKAWVCATRWRS